MLGLNSVCMFFIYSWCSAGCLSYHLASASAYLYYSLCLFQCMKLMFRFSVCCVECSVGSLSRTTVEQLQNEINALDSRIKKVRKEIDRPSTEKEIKMQMAEFLQVGRPVSLFHVDKHSVAQPC